MVGFWQAFAFRDRNFYVDGAGTPACLGIGADSNARHTGFRRSSLARLPLFLGTKSLVLPCRYRDGGSRWGRTRTRGSRRHRYRRR
jgi:hypothetical protein